MASKAIGFLNFKFGADLSGFERAMNKAQKKLKKFGKNIQKTGKSLTTGLTLPIVALGAASLKTFADFEQSMLKVKAISGATQAEFKSLTDSAKLLGSTTMFTATQVSELQLNLSKLGLTPKEINNSTQAILNLAQATDSDLGQAATVGASTMNAFGLEAQDMTMIADVMADAFSSTALDLEKFQTAMASVAPVAAQAGQDIQGTSAILGVLVNNGIEASSAGTALRNVFLELSNQGITWDQAMKKIQGSMNPLKTAMDLFGKRGASVATIIANNGIEIKSLTEDFRDSSGEAQAMADIMDSGVAGSMRRMQSQLEGVAIELGEHLIPAFNTLIGYLESGVKWFSSLSNSQKENLVKWGLMLAAIGPVLIIIGKMSIGISALIPVFSKLTAVMMANPYLAIAAAIIVVVASVYKLTTALTAQYDSQKNINELNKQAASNISDQLSSIHLLTTAIDDENTSLEDKQKALNTLQNLYPGYYDEVDETTFSQDMMTASTERLKKSLVGMARLEVYKDRLQEVVGELTKVEESTGDASMSTNVMSKAAMWALGPIGQLGAAYDFLTGDVSDAVQVEIDHTDVINLNEELEDLTDKIFSLEDELKDGIPIDPEKNIKKVTHNVKELNKETEDLTDNSEKLVKPIEAITLAAQEYKMELSTAPDYDKLFPTGKINEFAGGLGILGDRMAIFFGQDVLEMEAGIMSVMENIGGELSQGADSFKEYGQVVKGVIRDVIGGLISQGITAALTNAMSSIPPFPGSVFLIPALAGAAAGLARTAFNSLIPQFAEGGLVTNPTLGLIGEGIGTTAANPEVVAPLDKLKSMIGGGNQHITVTGKLIGNDIFLSNSITGVNRLRTT